jgi:putative GTP pyrophosphokinase
MHDDQPNIPSKKVLEYIYQTNIDRYEEVLEEFKRHTTELLKASSLQVSLKARVKSFDSYYRKYLKRLQENGYAADAVKLHDLLGVRIVCPFIEDLEQVKRVLRERFEIVETEEKNYEQTFKEFGYRSTHIIVKLPFQTDIRFPLPEEPVCEIQLRTLLQDAWAEVEHELIYKSEFTPFDEALKRKLAALNATLTLSDIIFQEIRNYQNQLHIQIEKRRKIFLDRLREQGGRDQVPDDGPSKTEPASTWDGRPAYLEELPLKVDLRHMADNGNQNDIDQYLLDALHAHNAYDFPKAIELYTKIFELSPPENIKSIIYVHRGMAYFTESKFTEALEDFDHALECDRCNCKALNYRALIHETFGNDSSAIEDYGESLKHNPFQYEPLIGRAKIHLKLGRIEQALEDAQRASSIYPDAEEVAQLLEKIRSRIRNR